jgi:hypothetical protein
MVLIRARFGVLGSALTSAVFVFAPPFSRQFERDAATPELLWHDAARAELRAALAAEEDALRRQQAAVDAAAAGGAPSDPLGAPSDAPADAAAAAAAADADAAALSTAAGVGAAFVTGSPATSASLLAPGAGCQRLSWNYAEFSVRYSAALGRELCVDGTFVRLLAEAAERGAPVTVRKRSSGAGRASLLPTL